MTKNIQSVAYALLFVYQNEICTTNWSKSYHVLFTSQITSFISPYIFFGITIQLASERGEIERKKQTRSGPSTVCLGYNELKVLLPSEWGEVQRTKQTQLARIKGRSRHRRGAGSNSARGRAPLCAARQPLSLPSEASPPKRMDADAA